VSQCWLFVVVFVTSLGLAVPTQAQVLGTGVIPVTEVGADLVQNSITASQSIVTAVHAVLSVANQVLELTPVEEVIVGAQIAEDLALLAEIVSTAELVWYDLQSLDMQITQLFGLDNAPHTRSGLEERILAIKQFYYQSLTFAMRTQTLLMTVFRTVDHISRLIDAVGALVGNLQGNQVLVQTNATMSKTLTVIEVQTAAWQRADTVQRLSEGVIKESLARIDDARWESWPRFER